MPGRPVGVPNLSPIVSIPRRVFFPRRFFYHRDLDPIHAVRNKCKAGRASIRVFGNELDIEAGSLDPLNQGVHDLHGTSHGPFAYSHVNKSPPAKLEPSVIFADVPHASHGGFHERMRIPDLNRRENHDFARFRNLQPLPLVTCVRSCGNPILIGARIFGVG